MQLYRSRSEVERSGQIWTMRKHPNFSRRKYSPRLWNQDSGVVSGGNCWMMSPPPTFPPPSLSPFLCLLLYCDHIQELTFLASFAEPVLHLQNSREVQSGEGSSEITDSFGLEQQNRVAVSCSQRSSVFPSDPSGFVY